MTEPGEGHETVLCPNCGHYVGGDEPDCPLCGESLWGGFDREDDEDDDEDEELEAGTLMTLEELPNLALFTFVREVEGYPTSQVWQKQFRPGTGPAEGLTIEYVAQAKKTARGWSRGSLGMGGIGGSEQVTLVMTRRATLQTRPLSTS